MFARGRSQNAPTFANIDNCIETACCIRQHAVSLKLGMPEARIPLGDAAVLMATSPKSNSGHVALDAALEDVRKGKGGDFPRHLQNMHADSYTMEREQGYLYPHSFPGHWVAQQYLPDGLVGTRYYEYGQNKLEQAAKQYWDSVKGK